MNYCLMMHLMAADWVRTHAILCLQVKVLQRKYNFRFRSFTRTAAHFVIEFTYLELL